LAPVEHPVVSAAVVPAPVVLVHGWGGSYDSTWRSSGFADLVEDAGRTVIGVDLLGHGRSPKPHDPAAYADLTAGVLEALPAGPVDAVGFSLGALTLLRLAVDHPDRIQRLVLAGIGRNAIEAADAESHRRLVSALEGEPAEDDNMSRLFVQYADQPGNDRVALTAIMKRERAPFTDVELARVSCPTLVIIGDKDFAGPGEPLASRLPNAGLVTLRGVDHFATPQDFGFFDAALEFVGALPG
jgi:pimeloyl-ACP methyl ester carboxylesterase